VPTDEQELPFEYAQAIDILLPFWTKLTVAGVVALPLFAEAVQAVTVEVTVAE
jgi:hypothetical protein